MPEHCNVLRNSTYVASIMYHALGAIRYYTLRTMWYVRTMYYVLCIMYNVHVNVYVMYMYMYTHIYVHVHNVHVFDVEFNHGLVRVVMFS